jgi:hypothetical protein
VRAKGFRTYSGPGLLAVGLLSVLSGSPGRTGTNLASELDTSGGLAGTADIERVWTVAATPSPSYRSG